MDDVELERLRHELDLIADGFPMGRAFWSSALYEFKELLKGTFQDRAQEQVLVSLGWSAHRYEARDQERRRAQSVHTLRYWTGASAIACSPG